MRKLFTLLVLLASALSLSFAQQKAGAEKPQATQKKAVQKAAAKTAGAREAVATQDAPKAVGPYSQAIKANGFVFVSGQIPFDPATGQVVSGDIAAQTERVLKNLSAVLAAAGSSLDRAVKTTVFLKNMSEKYSLPFSHVGPSVNVKPSASLLGFMPLAMI